MAKLSSDDLACEEIHLILMVNFNARKNNTQIARNKCPVITPLSTESR